MRAWVTLVFLCGAVTTLPLPNPQQALSEEDGSAHDALHHQVRRHVPASSYTRTGTTTVVDDTEEATTINPQPPEDPMSQTNNLINRFGSVNSSTTEKKPAEATEASPTTPKAGIHVKVPGFHVPLPKPGFGFGF